MDRVSPQIPGIPYRVEFASSGERLVLPIRRDWRWVIIWVGASLAIELFRIYVQSDHTYFPIIPAIVVVFALVDGFTSVFGQETIQIGHGELAHTLRIFGMKRQAKFRTAEIAALTTVPDNFTSPRDNDTLVSLRSDFGKKGAIKFDYRDKSIYLGLTIRDEDVPLVLAWITRRLPASAMTY